MMMMSSLPMEIVSHILRYVSTPIADVMRSSPFHAHPCPLIHLTPSVARTSYVATRKDYRVVYRQLDRQHASSKEYRRVRRLNLLGFGYISNDV